MIPADDAKSVDETVHGESRNPIPKRQGDE